MNRHNKFTRYLFGGLFGMLAEYIGRVDHHPVAIILLVCFGMYILFDLVTDEK